MAGPVFEAAREYAEAMTARDPLAGYRERFHIPRAPDGNDCVYLCGHSLGLQPKTVRANVEQELKDWEQLGVEAHFHAQHPWMPYHRFLTEQTARVIGTKPEEVVVMNSLTLNLHLMMVSFYRPSAGRHRILIEANAFPSDQYAVRSQIRFRGFDPASSLLELRPRAGEVQLRDEDIFSLIEREGQSIALIMLGGVNYFSGQAFDLAAITKAGHAQGCVVGFDLAHAAGNILLNLHDWDADFAVWCTYKYLNGGPGCVGGCFVHERHAREWDLPRFAGWWGHDEQSRFRMRPDFVPMKGAEGWQLSNPSILTMAALRASLDIFNEVGMQRLREKSISLTGYLEFLLNQRPSSRFTIVTPHEPERRGAQLSLQIGEGAGVVQQKLAAAGVLCDLREPDILRAAPVPLYNTYEDVYRFAERFLVTLEDR
ncbi:MAG: kynureninase [Terriglobales bacterium]